MTVNLLSLPIDNLYQTIKELKPASALELSHPILMLL